MSIEQVKVTFVGWFGGVVMPLQSFAVAASSSVEANWRSACADANLIVGLLAGVVGLIWWSRRLWRDINHEVDEPEE